MEQCSDSFGQDKLGFIQPGADPDVGILDEDFLDFLGGTAGQEAELLDGGGQGDVAGAVESDGDAATVPGQGVESETSDQGGIGFVP